MGKFEFRYRLTNKSSLAAIARAVRALGYGMNIEEKGGFTFSWWLKSPTEGHYYDSMFVLDENVPKWLNERLEANGLLAPEDKC